MRVRVRIAALGAVLAAVALMTGCATFGTFETAQTASPGQFQFGGALTPVNAVFSDDTSGAVFFPFPALFTKVGVAPGFDLGATWSFGPGVGLNGKLQFMDGATDGAILLGGSFYGVAIAGSSFGIYSIGPRLFFSSEKEGAFPFMLNIGATYSGAGASGAGVSASGGTLLAVGGAGVPFRLGANRSSRVMPELQLSVPVMSTYTSGEESNTTATLESFVASLGVCFGHVGAERD